MKMENKIKNRSPRYDTKRPRPIHGPNYLNTLSIKSASV